MNDFYYGAFHNLVKETKEQTGLDLPAPIELYVSMLLANFMDKPDFLPEEGFARAYLKLKKPANYNAKELGDACLIISGAFQTYGQHLGLTRKYYCDIGISSYEMVASTLNHTLFATLSQHFVFVSNFIDCVVSPKVQHKGLYC